MDRTVITRQTNYTYDVKWKAKDYQEYVKG